jgi:flagellar biosynthesis/type III secretory pathway protein FliH
LRFILASPAEVSCWLTTPALAAEEVRKLFRLIDWLMALPPPLAEQFHDELTRIAEEKQMAYVTSTERIAEEKGRKQGREEGWEKGLKRGIHAVLESRFGDAGLRLMLEIEALRDVQLLETILEQANRVSSPEQLRDCWKQP